MKSNSLNWITSIVCLVACVFFTCTSKSFAERVTTDLVVLYTLDENSGSIVYDTSGVTPALDLINNTPTATSWVPGGLSVNTHTAIASTSPATKIYNACTNSNEITIEAWIKPENLTQAGPARIVTFSQNWEFRNFTLGQTESHIAFRLRTTTTNLNGSPTLHTNNGDITTDLSHIVCTRNSIGNVTVYVDSIAVSTTSISGDFSNWDNTQHFGMANELSQVDDRLWLGELHLVAVYSRALSSAEVLQNFTHSANATPTITPTFTFTATPTRTATPTQTFTTTPIFSTTSTPIATQTATATQTPSATTTIMITATPTPTTTSSTTQTPVVSATPTNTTTTITDKPFFTYPQPAKNETLYFHFNLVNTAEITIEVFNVLGEKTKTITFQPSTPNQLTYAWNIQDVAPGIYFYRVTHQDANNIKNRYPPKKIIIVK